MSEEIVETLKRAEKMIGKAKIKIYVYNDNYEILKDVDGFNVDSNVDGDWLFMYKNIEDGTKEIYIFSISSIKQIAIYKGENEK